MLPTAQHEHALGKRPISIGNLILPEIFAYEIRTDEDYRGFNEFFFIH